MWKRICAYIVGIPLVFMGLFYAYVWHADRKMRLEGRKVLAEIIAREDALDSLGDIALDPANVTLADLERSLHQPSVSLAGGHNTTRIGWACAANDCEAWASFLQTTENKLDPNAVPLLFSIRDHVMRKRLHQISIGGVYLGEPVSEMVEYCQRRGYAAAVGSYHRIKWSKDWSVIWTESGNRINSLIFLNDNLIKNAQAHLAGQAQEASP